MEETKEPSDEELVKIIRDGEQERYTDLVRRYEHKLFRYALVFTSDQDLAEDIIQNSFIKAFINLNSFNIKRKYSSWMYRIVHNEAVNAVKRRRQPVSIDGPEAKLVVDQAETPDELYQREEVKEELGRCLKKMPMKYREPLVLFYFDGYSYEDISDIMRLPVGTVGARITRGRRMLKMLCDQKTTNKH